VCFRHQAVGSDDTKALPNPRDRLQEKPGSGDCPSVVSCSNVPRRTRCSAFVRPVLSRRRRRVQRRVVSRGRIVSQRRRREGPSAVARAGGVAKRGWRRRGGGCGESRTECPPDALGTRRCAEDRGWRGWGRLRLPRPSNTASGPALAPPPVLRHCSGDGSPPRRVEPVLRHRTRRGLEVGWGRRMVGRAGMPERVVGFGLPDLRSPDCFGRFRRRQTRGEARRRRAPRGRRDGPRGAYRRALHGVVAQQAGGNGASLAILARAGRFYGRMG